MLKFEDVLADKLHAVGEAINKAVVAIEERDDSLANECHEELYTTVNEMMLLFNSWLIMASMSEATTTEGIKTETAH